MESKKKEEKYEHLRKWQQERDAAIRAKALERLGIIEPEIPELAIKTIAHGMGAIYGANWSSQDGGWDKQAKQFLESFICLPSVPLTQILPTKLHKQRYRGFGRKPRAYILYNPIK